MGIVVKVIKSKEVKQLGSFLLGVIVSCGIANGCSRINEKERQNKAV